MGELWTRHSAGSKRAILFENMQIRKDDFYVYLNSILGIEVDDNTYFFDDIGMDGLDAWQFIETIAKKFEVDFSEYNWQEYHDSEADITNILKAIMGIFKRKNRQKKFSALHLFNVVQAGKWSEPSGYLPESEFNH